MVTAAGARRRVTGGARFVAASTTGDRVLVTQDNAGPGEAKVFWAHTPPQGTCENLVCALKFLANQQTGGDSLVDTIFEGLQEQSRMNITNERRRFIEVDNHETVKIGYLEKNSEAIRVVRPKYNKETYQIREGVSESTFREGEEGTLRSFINTACVGDSRRGPPLVDEDWHAVCQAIYKGVEGAEWENFYCKFVEMNKEDNVRHPSGSSKPRRCGRR